MFQPAVKTESKLRMAIAGPSGSGKTYTALSVAAALVPGGKVAVIDTEHGSAAKYADLFTFDVANAAPRIIPTASLSW
jgi:type II secretory pathway predicted ATPase ExeA